MGDIGVRGANEIARKPRSVRSVCDARKRKDSFRRKAKRAILDASLDPIVMLGADGMIMESNRAAQGLLQPLPVPADGGLTEPEAHRSAGRRLAEIFRVRDREKVSSWQRRQWAPKTAE